MQADLCWFCFLPWFGALGQSCSNFWLGLSVARQACYETLNDVMGQSTIESFSEGYGALRNTLAKTLVSFFTPAIEEHRLKASCLLA